DARNVVSGNTRTGILIQGTGNIVQGNYVGTSASGTVAVPNVGLQSGIFIQQGVLNRILDNVVSGNAVHAVTICCVGATRNAVQGNFIGTDPTGMVRVANGGIGVDVVSGANNVIGGAGAARNVISGNQTGMQIRTGATGTLVQNNYIGVNAAGTAALPNG